MFALTFQTPSPTLFDNHTVASWDCIMVLTNRSEAVSIIPQLFWECLHLRTQGQEFGMRSEVPITNLTHSLGPGSEGKGLWAALGPAEPLGRGAPFRIQGKAP